MGAGLSYKNTKTNLTPKCKQSDNHDTNTKTTYTTMIWSLKRPLCSLTVTPHPRPPTAPLAPTAHHPPPAMYWPCWKHSYHVVRVNNTLSWLMLKALVQFCVCLVRFMGWVWWSGFTWNMWSLCLDWCVEWKFISWTCNVCWAWLSNLWLLFPIPTWLALTWLKLANP